MAQRKAKQSRAQTLARRRRQDLHDAQRDKHNGPWKRKDRRRAAFQTMKARFRIVQHYRRLCRSGMKKGEAAQRTAEAFGCSASTVRNYERLVRQYGKRGLMPEIRVRETPSRTPLKVIQITLMLRGLLGGKAIVCGRTEESHDLHDFRARRVSRVQAVSGADAHVSSRRKTGWDCVQTTEGDTPE